LRMAQKVNAMPSIKAIIADERQAIGQMEDLLAELWPELVICGRGESGPEALQLIQKRKPDLAFLEVRLPGFCGMQVARMTAGTCQVVFTTNYDHYAANAFENGALDYLLKPVSRERLQKSIQRAKRQLSISPTAPMAAASEQTQPASNRPALRKSRNIQWVCSLNRGRSKLIAVEKVYYFKADNKYTLVITEEGEALINKTIKCLADELDRRKFWRIHRSTIVNVEQIEEVSRTKTGRGALQLKNCSEILTVSRPNLHLFKQM
jgi:DNA-binding LytR/AlgR family response regulator